MPHHRTVAPVLGANQLRSTGFERCTERRGSTSHHSTQISNLRCGALDIAGSEADVCFAISLYVVDLPHRVILVQNSAIPPMRTMTWH
jgi:hypothetical protein